MVRGVESNCSCCCAVDHRFRLACLVMCSEQQHQGHGTRQEALCCAAVAARQSARQACMQPAHQALAVCLTCRPRSLATCSRRGASDTSAPYLRPRGTRASGSSARMRSTHLQGEGGQQRGARQHEQLAGGGAVQRTVQEQAAGAQSSAHTKVTTRDHLDTAGKQAGPSSTTAQPRPPT